LLLVPGIRLVDLLSHSRLEDEREAHRGRLT
jgi:hypothetical protein